MDLEPLCPDQQLIGPGFVFGRTWPELTMQMIKSFLYPCATALVFILCCGHAAETDTQAQAKAREALNEKGEDLNSRSQRAVPIVSAQPASSVAAADTESQAKARQALRDRDRDWGTSAQPAQPIPTTPAAAAAPPSTTSVVGTETEAQIKAREALREKLGQATSPPGSRGTNASAPEQVTDFRNVPQIKGIVIVRSLKEFSPDGVPLRPGLTVTNNALLERPQFARITDRFLGRSMDPARMRELQREIIIYYRQHDHPLVDVLYPEQDVNNGMLQIIVIEGRLKEIKVQDKQGNPYTNGWTGVKFVQEAIHLRTNDVIIESRVDKDIDWLNRNPFRSVEALYQPDKREYGSTSLLLRVNELRPWSVDFGYEDTGSRVTSEDRLTAGVTWGKAFGLNDNQFRYAFTFDPSFDLLRVHSASYYMPLPWRHGLRLSGYYLDVTGELGPGSTLSGNDYQGSLRYEVPLPTIGRLSHGLSAGLDFKHSENNLIFNQLTADNRPTEIFQVAAGYTAALMDPWGQTSVSIQGYFSPGGVTTLNSDGDFARSRPPSAKASYGYGRFNLERATKLPGDFTWIVRGIAQVASGNLLPSEQLGMGGYATVRGYEEREGNGDQGFFISNELRTPPLSLLHLFTKKVALEDKLQLLGFWDYGEVDNIELLSGEKPHYFFSSVGPGLRYSLSRHFSLRFDYGWQLLNSGLDTTGQHSRGHVGVVATY